MHDFVAVWVDIGFVGFWVVQDNMGGVSSRYGFCSALL